jgi:hypothetical protein
VVYWCRAEAQGAIISGQLDIAVSVGNLDRARIDPGRTGSPLQRRDHRPRPDIYCFVPPAVAGQERSPTRKGKSMGYSVAGSSTTRCSWPHSAQANLDAKPTPPRGARRASPPA